MLVVLKQYHPVIFQPSLFRFSHCVPRQCDSFLFRIGLMLDYVRLGASKNADILPVYFIFDRTHSPFQPVRTVDMSTELAITRYSITMISSLPTTQGVMPRRQWRHFTTS